MERKDQEQEQPEKQQSQPDRQQQPQDEERPMAKPKDEVRRKPDMEEGEKDSTVGKVPDPQDEKRDDA